jgi:hypothetical protein
MLVFIVVQSGFIVCEISFSIIWCSVNIFTSPYHPDQLWGLTSYPVGTGGSFPGDKAAGARN